MFGVLFGGFHKHLVPERAGKGRASREPGVRIRRERPAERGWR